MKVLPRLASENIWEFLPYTTLREVTSEVWGYFWAWFIMSAISLLIAGAFEFLGGLFSLGSPSFPRWLTLAVLASAVLWFARGQHVSFQMPRVGWKSWLFLTVLFTAWFAVAEHGEWWVSLPFFWALIMTIACLDALAEKGRHNYQKLERKEDEAL